MISNNYPTSNSSVSQGVPDAVSEVQIKSKDLASTPTVNTDKNTIYKSTEESEVSLMSSRQLQSHIYLRSIVEHLKLEMPNGNFPLTEKLSAKLSDNITLSTPSRNIAPPSMPEGENTVDAKAAVEESVALFDFEAVTKEVMLFVSSALSNAKARGSNDEELKFMFEQAHVGVGMGIDEAVEELQDFSLMNDGIMSGIDKSRVQITEALEELQQSYFPEEQEEIA